MDTTVTQLMPEWTEDDFYEDGVYRWLWEHRNDGFLFQKCMAKVQRKAKELKIIGFTKMWNAYVQAMNPRQNVLGINATEFPDQPVQLQCGHYMCDETGIHYEGRMGEEIKVCSHPIMPVKRITDIDTNEEKLMIAYNRGGGKWKELVVGRGTLASAQKIIGLADKGIAVTSESAKELVKYIVDVESENYNELPVQNGTGHVGWLPDGQFAPYADGIVYGGESQEFNRMYGDFKEHGLFAAWMGIAKAARSGKSVPARIALAASFAAPLVPLLNGLPFFVHLWGTQGCGKTVGLMLAASVWGNPMVGRLIKTFGGTKVSLEQYASFCANVPIMFDELQVISDRKSFDDLIYMLCEGTSKGRGAKEGGLQLQRHWSSTIITTGEMPIVQSNSGGGAAVRTIEVNYGGEPLFEDARGVANALKANYGFVGKRFVEALKTPETIDRIKETQNKFYNELAGDIQDKQVLSASILLAADALATEVIFQDGKALTARDIKPYLITREQADANYRCYNWLIGYIGANPKRFETEDNNGELWGKKEGGFAYIIRSIFDRILQSEGYSASAFLTWAKRHKKILCDDYEGENKRLTVRKVIGGTRLICVALALPTDDGYVEVAGDDLPF